MKKIGILHISDVHINASSISEIDLLVEKLINDIKKVKIENDINIDLICFTGDLIGRGDKAFNDEMQIQLAEKHFIQPLLKEIGLTEKEFNQPYWRVNEDSCYWREQLFRALRELFSLFEYAPTILTSVKPEQYLH